MTQKRCDGGYINIIKKERGMTFDKYGSVTTLVKKVKQAHICSATCLHISD